MPTNMTSKVAARLLGGDYTLKKLVKEGKLPVVGRGFGGTKMFNSSDVYALSKRIRQLKEL